MELEKNYNFMGLEEKWYDFWIKNRYFEPGESKPHSNKENNSFCIVIPPPNVTGLLHMGHALDNTIQDIIIRYNRMRYGNTIWVPGTDHGGIATQNVVERLIKKEGVSRDKLGRDEFLKKMWSWRSETGDTILLQLRKLGCSCDWSRTRFTMDETCSTAVYNAFKILYERGLIYRGVRMVNWCPRCHTALSDIEVEHENKQGNLWHIKYPLADKKGEIVVATTRPETMLGDTAVAVNPDDKKYKKFIGRKVILPLMNREIPIVADSAVEASFGTGAVKVTPSHDPLDAEIGMRHKLGAPVVIGFDGRITSEGGPYSGLDRYEARKKIVSDLEEQGYLVKVEDYAHSVGSCYRCSNAVEPLNSKQWFLNTSGMAKKAVDAVNSKKIQFFPSSWEKPYLIWMENLKDWCISRQIWWGHRIPIWYCPNESCVPVVSDVKPGKCPACGSTELLQDPDVLDTWFSSGLWPFSVFGWPEQTPDLKRFYPTRVLCCGYEILYLWVARMIMMGIELNGDIPFKHVNIHGIVRDMKGKKMSKSLGNVVDPLDLIKKFGTDSLRFIIAQSGVLGRDMQLGEESFTAGRNFTNKIWNASRFVISNIEAGADLYAEEKDLSVFDRWILSELKKLSESISHSLEGYDVAVYARALYEFVWFKYCDWFLEISKMGLRSQEKKNTTLSVLLYVLTGIIKLIHPVMPFISEEIYQKLRELFSGRKISVCGSEVVFGCESIMIADFPEVDKKGEIFSKRQESLVSLFMEIVTSVRNLRAEMKVSHDKKLSLFIKTADKEIADFALASKEILGLLAKIERVEAGAEIEKPANSAALAFSMGVGAFVPLEGIIDFEKEKLRLHGEITKIEDDIELSEKKLRNELFITRAPKHEIDKVKERKKSTLDKRDNLIKYLKILENK